MNLENILLESDSTKYSGDVLHKNLSALNKISKQDNFYFILDQELKKSVDKNKLNRFCFIAHLLIVFGNDCKEYQSIYNSMIEFLNKDFELRSNEENEQILIVILDLMWHQDQGLKYFKDNEQMGLSLFLKNCTKHTYQIDENGDDIFFAIKRSISLFKFQKKTGNTEDIIELYLNHFDEKIRQEVTEMKSKNWL